jgi:hypothetical protein
MLAQALALALSSGFAPAAIAPRPLADLLVLVSVPFDPAATRPVIERSPERAEHALSELADLYPRVRPKDQRTIARSLAELVRESAGEEAWRDVCFSAAHALAEMEGRGVEELLDLVDAEHLEVDLELQRELALALGRTHDPDALERLVRLLEHPEPLVQSSAAEALGEFASLEQGERKDVFRALLNTLLARAQPVVLDPSDTDARWRYDAVRGAITTSLRRLSGHTEHDPDQWLRFWNKHKRDDWDAPRFDADAPHTQSERR